jgi:hypothetical protein
VTVRDIARNVMSMHELQATRGSQMANIERLADAFLTLIAAAEEWADSDEVDKVLPKRAECFLLETIERLRQVE